MDFSNSTFGSEVQNFEKNMVQLPVAPNTFVLQKIVFFFFKNHFVRGAASSGL